MNSEIGIDMYTLICIKWITNKNLLYKKTIKLKNLKKMNIYSPNITRNYNASNDVTMS